MRIFASHTRGSALVLVTVLLVVLTLVGISVVKMASSEVDAVGAKRRFDKGVTCADAARDLLTSQFRTFGVSPTQLVLDTVIDDRHLGTGHYDNVAVTSVVSTTAASAQSAIGVSDIANRITRGGLGGQFYRMTVVCSKAGADGLPAGEQNEVEYLVRFGL